MKSPSDETLRRLGALAATPEIPGTRYALAERVGAGGMGEVWRARDRELERDVAIKIVHDARDPRAFAERLLREARTIARLEHPGIPPVHEIGTLADGRTFYAMKFVAGQTLRHAQSPSQHAALRLFLRLCETVAYAHERGVVHRDLKPDNVMLGPLGELYVMDWGIAGALETPGQPGSASGILGTPGFMAPEQARTLDAPIDARADVFALGGLLAFLVTGKGPSAEGGLELGGLPRRLAAVIAKAREREPDRRYPSALELARDVEAYLDRGPMLAYREGVLERAGRFLQRHQFVAWLVVGYLTLRLLVLFFFHH